MSTNKPSHSEEEYFAREEVEKKRRHAVEHAKHLGDEERAHLKKLHHNHCPHCGMEMHQLVFRGVVADKCFGCNGIFLNDGELQKLIGNTGNYWDSMLQFFSHRDFGNTP